LLPFLPQYWGHRVISLETSISVNSFSDSHETMMYYEIQKIPIGFFSSVTPRTLQAVSLSQYLLDVVKKSLKDEDPKEFIRSVFHSRYEHLYSSLSKQGSENLCLKEQ